MKRLFVIHTPYQLIAAVNIINSDHSYENKFERIHNEDIHLSKGSLIRLNWPGRLC